MSTYYQAKFTKREKDGTERSFTAVFPGCFQNILDRIDCKATREEEREDYTVDVSTYVFADIKNVYIPALRKEKREANRKIKSLEKNLYRVKNAEVYELITDEISCKMAEINEINAEVAFADTVTKGVSFHFCYVEDLFDDDDILMEVELC